jgi:predicted methyltransferase
MSVSSPLLTIEVHEALVAAARAGVRTLECSLDLERSRTTVEVGETTWRWREQSFPFLERCTERTIYYWTGEAFEPAARYGTSLIKLVSTDWGPPTFEIDGVKMLPTLRVSPYADAEHKVSLIQPRGKRILDACGGLGYFAAWCLQDEAAHVLSFEKNPDVMWLRSLNPWSPAANERLTLQLADVADAIATISDASFDAVLHDPPRFSLAGELYSQAFYEQLARVLRRGGKLFHYTGAPNKLSRGRDLAHEVALRLQRAGFTAQRCGDGVLAVRR